MKKTDNFVEKDPLSIYLKQIAAYPLLSREEELRLAKRIARYRTLLQTVEERYRDKRIDRRRYLSLVERCEEWYRTCKHRMITSNLRLVVSIAKKYQFRGLGLLDLIDEGNLGLIDAVERYDYSRGCKFSTYGTWWIQQAILKALADKGRPIRIPIHALAVVRKYYSALKFLRQEMGRNPTTSELSETMRIPEEKIRHLARISQDMGSLDVSVDSDSMTSLLELIDSEEYSGPFETAFSTTIRHLIDENLGKLDEREQIILRLRFGLQEEGPLTLEGIGLRFGITRERVRQIQNRAIDKLKSFAAIQELKEYI